MLASSTAALPTASHSASSLHMVEGSPAAELLQRMNSPTKKAAMLRSWVAESERSSYEDLPAARDPAHHPHTMTEHVEHSWMQFDGVPENEEAVRLYDQLLSLMATKQYAEALSVCQHIRRIDAKNTMVASYEEVLRAQIDAHQMEDDDKSFDCEGPYAESDDEVEEEAEQ